MDGTDPAQVLKLVELVTHALLGAAVGLSMRGISVVPRRDCVGLACTGAIFPDVDFVGFLISPLRFLADWHQAATHSLLLLPLWGLLAAGLYAWWRAAGARFGAAVLLFSAGVASHIGLDVLTAYGTMLLYPASDQRFSLSLLYVVDPYFTSAVVLGLLALQRWPRGPAALTACLLLGGYLALAAYSHLRAFEIARSTSPEGMERVDVFPQPFSPFNWKLIATDGTDHLVAHVNLFGHPQPVPSFAKPLGEIVKAFRSPSALEWKLHSLRLPASSPQELVAARLWMDPRFEPFRRFATHPAVDTTTGTTGCIWFTDLRYDVPGLPATFRYGFCPSGNDGDYALHRLRYFSTDRRSAL
jgi:inner membrane protein